jgi:hypothetical protein
MPRDTLRVELPDADCADLQTRGGTVGPNFTDFIPTLSLPSRCEVAALPHTFLAGFVKNLTRQPHCVLASWQCCVSSH